MTDRSPSIIDRTDRRAHLVRLAWGMVAASGGAALYAGTAVLFPRVRHRPPSEFDAGRPEDLAVGQVSERHLRSHKVILCRDEVGIYALYAVCTHLGCITRWQPSQDQMRCFCHGSAFLRTGENVEGPAPRPLERARVRLDPNGRLLVDTAVRYRAERGEWDSEGAILPFPVEGRGGRTELPGHG